MTSGSSTHTGATYSSTAVWLVVMLPARITPPMAETGIAIPAGPRLVIWHANLGLYLGSTMTCQFFNDIIALISSHSFDACSSFSVYFYINYYIWHL